MIFRKLFPSPKKVGEAAPEFRLPDQHGKEHTLAMYRGRWLVIYFYPKDHTLGCTQEACSFRDNIQVFNDKDVTILGVSADGVESHKGFADKHGLPFPILADTQRNMSIEYGALLPFGIANRVTFIVDPQGRIADRLDWVRWDTYSDTVIERLAKLQ